MKKMKKNILILLVFVLTLTSCRLDVEPNVEVKNDIHLTIDGENLEGFVGEWIITSEEMDKDGKKIIIIRIEKKEIN
tara:strand:- start:3863 stop:4093 length:231 start_codon:yes stop_codon:yes gene_type:complete